MARFAACSSVVSVIRCPLMKWQSLFPLATMVTSFQSSSLMNFCRSAAAPIGSPCTFFPSASIVIRWPRSARMPRPFSS